MILLRFEDGEATQRLWAFGEPERGGLTVTIESHALDGRELTLTGHFEGTLGTSRTKGREVDLSEGLPVSGTFSVMLVEQD